VGKEVNHTVKMILEKSSCIVNTMNYFFDKSTSRSLTHAEFVSTYFPSLFKAEHFNEKNGRVLHTRGLCNDDFDSPSDQFWVLFNTVRSKLLYASGLTKRTKEPSCHPAFAKALSEAKFDFEFVIRDNDRLRVGKAPVCGNMVELEAPSIEEEDSDEEPKEPKESPARRFFKNLRAGQERV
jgi:hypothetical protein